MNQNAIYRKEVNVLMERLLVKPDGAIIMNTPEHKLALGRSEIIVFTQPDGKKELLNWDEVGDELLYDIFCFLDTAQKLSPEVVENFVQLGREKCGSTNRSRKACVKLRIRFAEWMHSRKNLFNGMDA